MRLHQTLTAIFLSLIHPWVRAGDPAYQRPAGGDPLAVHTWRLANGLEVRLSENHELPQFYAEIVVKVGSKNDPPDCTGLAHYLEHLLFKGSTRLGTIDYEKEKPHLDQITALYEGHFREPEESKRAAIYAEINQVAQKAAAYAIPNEFDTLYQSMGASGVNAHTSVEETVYKCTLPSNRLRQWAEVESDRFSHPVFRLFHTELETVYEEKNRSLDNKYDLLFEASDRLVFPLHPYGRQTTIGEAAHLKKPSLVRIQQFFDTWYVPQNMVICLSGDLDPQETIRIIDTAFSPLPAKTKPDPTLWIDSGPAKPQRVEISYPGEEYVMITYRTVPAGHPDEDGLCLMDMILSNSATGLIDIDLNHSQKVKSAGCEPQIMRDAGLQRFWGIPRDGQSVKQVEKLLRGEMRKVREGKFDETILPAILSELRREQARQKETNEGRVSAMRESAVLGQPWERTVGRLERLSRVTKQDIVRVARTYLGEKDVTAVIRDGKREVPSIEKPAIDAVPIPEGRRSAFAADILNESVKEQAPRFLQQGRDYSVHHFAGLTLVHHPNPVNDLFTLDIILPHGTRQNPLLPLALRLVEKCGVGQSTSAEIARQWYQLGAEWSHESDTEETVLHVSGLEENLGAALLLLRRQLLEPKPEKNTWNQLRGIVLKERADARKDPDQILLALAEKQSYGDQSLFLREPDTRALKNLTAPELFAELASALKHRHTITFTGKTAPADLLALLSKSWIQEDARPLGEEPVMHARNSVTNEVWWVQQETSQSSIRIAFPDGGPDESLVPVAQIFNSYFGTGMASLVFQEIRESRALAYSAWASYQNARAPDDENMFVAEVGTQCDKTAEALEVLLGLMHQMPEAADRFERAREGVVNQYRGHPLPFRDVVSVLRRWHALGLNVDPRAGRLAAVEKLKLNDVVAFAKKRIASRPVMISLVGDAGKFNVKALSRFGAVRELSVEELFAK